MAYIMKTQLAKSDNYGGARELSAIKYIIIHYTGNDGDSDEANAKYFATRIVKASAHYFVDDDSVTQSVPDNRIAYSVGGNKYSDCAQTGGGKLYKTACNSNSINIELCDTVKNGVVKATEATINNALALTKSLMALYNIPADHVIRHFDVNGKHCPAYWMSDTAWNNEFHNKLSATPSASATPATGEMYRVRKSWSDAKSQIGAYSNLDNAKAACKVGYTVYNNDGVAIYTKQAQTSSATATTPSASTTSKSSASSTYTRTQFVKDIQKAIGAKVDGIPGSETLGKTPTISKTKNRKHAVVKYIQKYLNTIGYNCGTVDGIAGSKFDSAVKSLQKWMKHPDGEITAKGTTWKHLLGM